jgi:PAS domain S-box-containing protein
MTVKDSNQIFKPHWQFLGLPRRIQITVWISISIAIAASLFDLAGWVFDVSVLKSIAPQWIPMKIITALCFFFSAISLVIIRQNMPALFVKILPRVLAVFIGLVSLLTLYVYIYTLRTGEESVLTGVKFLGFFLPPVMRMAFLTATNFLIISCILIILPIGTTKASVVTPVLLTPVILISYFVIVSYILGVYSVTELNQIPVALNTGIAFCALCAAILMIKPDTWLIKVITSGNTGAIITRRLIPPLMILPVAIGWLRIKGERAGLFESEEGVVLVAMTYTVCFIVLVWLTARSVNAIDRDRRVSEEALKKTNARMEILSEIAGRLLMSEDPQKLVNELCNRVMNFLNCQVFFNFLVDDNTDKLHLNTFAGISVKSAQKIEWLDFGSAVCGCVARDGIRIVAENITDTPDPRTNLIRTFGIKAYACHPLLSNDKILGTLSFGTNNRVNFSDDDLSLMKVVADQVAIAISRIKNENALHESEDRFRTIAESLPVQIAIIRIGDSTIRFTNEAYDKAFGFTRGELAGRKLSDIFFDPEDRKNLGLTLKEKGAVSEIEIKVKKSDGSPFWIMASIRTITFGHEPAYLIASIDITQRKKEQVELIQLNRTLNALGKSSQTMMHSGNELQYLKDVCKIIIEDCGHYMVWIGYAQNDKNKTVKPIAYCGFDEGYIERLNITWNDTERGNGPTGKAIRTGKPCLCTNMQTDPVFEPWREDAIKRGYASSLVLPLISDEKPFGAISIYSKETDPFSDKEVNLLSNLADDLAYGISYIRLMESEKRSLEKIKESEEKYKELVTNARSLIINMDVQGRFTFINEFTQDFFGYKEEEIIGKTAIETIVPLTESTGRNLVEMVENLYEDPDKYSININENIKKNGERVWIEWHNKALFNKNGKRIGHTAIGIDITKRKKAEEALLESEEKLWSVLNAAKESIYMFDRAGKFTVTNATGLRRMDKSNEQELIGHPFSEFMSEELARQRQAKLDSVFRIGKPLEFEDERGEFMFHHNFYPVYKDNEVINVVTYSADITDRKKAEKELQNTKNYLESLINYANAPIIVWSPDNKIRLFNHAFEHLTGYSSAEVEGKKLDLLFPETSLKESNIKIKHALTKNWETIEIPILTKNKEIRTVLWNSANIYDTDNKTVLSTIAQGNDITKRIKAEQEVSKSKEKLDIALENGNIGIWEWNLKTDEVIWDERMEKMFGLKPGTFGKTFKAFATLLNEEDVSHFQKSINKALEKGSPVETIFRAKSINGKSKYISSKALVNRDKEENPVSLTGVCFDVTAMREGTEQLVLKLNEDLLRSNKELEQFAYVASHDLQEPLRMISSFTQLLSMRYKDKLDEEAQEFIKFAVDGALRMQSLINDLLEYSRIGTRGKSLSAVNMYDIIGQTINNLGIKIKEKSALITNDELPTIFADGGQMVQLFQNLIGNSIKFCETSPRIHISAKEEQDQYLFEVKDNGIGIESQYFDRIFQIFQRLHPKDEYGGTGIGLAISKRIVERHGGKIWVESKPGEGTIFKFTVRKK